MMKTIWILAANAGRARLFSATSRNGALIEEQAWLDNEARMKGRDIVTDRQGRTFDGSGRPGYAMEPRVDVKSEEANRFARLLCRMLGEQADRKGCERLHIVASPAFLGRLREFMKHSLRNRISSELPKDLTTLDARALRRHLPDYL